MEKKYISRFLRKVFVLSFFIYAGSNFSQSITTTTISGTVPYCAGVAVNVTYAITGTFSNTPTPNVFTAQLSDASGSFSSPVTIGTRTATTAGSISCVIPFTTGTSSLYRIRTISSNPSLFGSDNGYNFTVNAPVISTPTILVTQFCQNEIFNVSFTKTCNFGTGNVFTFQLSDPFGSFTAPTTITSYTSTASGSFSMAMPVGTPAGAGYRIRVVSSVPAVTSADNGTNILVSVASGTPSVFGNGVWNAYCYLGNNNFSTNYQGFYTENALNIASTGKWVNTNSPSTASAVNGLAYSGCPFGNTNYSVIYKRTNFICGYYQIDIAGHDDQVYLFINGVNVYQHIGCCDAHTNVWTGFIGPSTTIEFRFTNGSGPGYLNVNFVPVNPLTFSPPATICSGSSTSITVNSSSTATLTYSWNPASSLNTSTSASVVASPTVTTNYSVTGTDAFTGCSVTNTILTTVNALPTTTIAATPTLICYGATSATLTTGGANSYTWSPAAGLNTTTGNTVVANPSVTTTYTVSGSNNCAVISATKIITVQTPPASPSQTVFGSGGWNVYSHFNQTFSNYYGFYTENNLSFNTQTRWNSTNGPSTNTTTSSGTAYNGCSFAGAPWSMSFKRTNIPCGYYQVDILTHDDNIGLYIDGVLTFSHAVCCDSHTAAWSGFIGPATTVEFRLINSGSTGFLSVNFLPIPYPVLSPPITICPSTSATLTSNFISGANYAWTPSVTLSSPFTNTTLA
ncbi:MAG: hypothetical protein H0W73_20900, partial [Bacteroidetes bacterium]|nr:hypothetical protein [Bacteroidota bacterium]